MGRSGDERGKAEIVGCVNVRRAVYCCSGAIVMFASLGYRSDWEYTACGAPGDGSANVATSCVELLDVQSSRGSGEMTRDEVIVEVDQGKIRKATRADRKGMQPLTQDGREGIVSSGQ
jgi:hypothetical protein